VNRFPVRQQCGLNALMPVSWRDEIDAIVKVLFVVGMLAVCRA